MCRPANALQDFGACRLISMGWIVQGSQGSVQGLRGNPGGPWRLPASCFPGWPVGAGVQSTVCPMLVPVDA